jgi:transmembrane sensor
MEELIAKVLSGEADESEVRACERWRRESPDNERTYQEFLHTWELAALHDSRPPIPPPPPIERIIERAEHRRRHAIPLRPASARRIRLWAWAAAAAVVLAAAGGALLLRTAPERHITAAAGETPTVALADGSIVRLSPGSRLVMKGVDERTVRLDGAAFFAVATDPSRPFTVETAVGRAEALGTRFEIRAATDTLRLVVVEGRVRLSADGQQVVARAGEASRIKGGAGPTPPQTVDVWQLVDWPQGLLIFQATPLRDALREVGNHFHLPVVIRDTAAAGTAVTAWFENEPVAEVVATVCQVVGAHCTVADTIAVGR